MILFSRVILDILLPPCGPFVVVLLGVVLMRTQRRKIGRLLVIFGFCCLYLLSTSIVSNLLIRPLENNFFPLNNIVSEVDAIVVLTFGVKDLSHLGLDPAPDSSSLSHLIHGIKIFKKIKGAPLIISGGRADPAKPELSTGMILGKEALALGIPKNKLIVEDDSLNTYEGALNVFKILKGKGKIVLVTSAHHMGRSVMLYRKVGFEVVPAPTSFMGEKITFGLHLFIPTVRSLGMSYAALYQYLCWSWYILKDFCKYL